MTLNLRENQFKSITNFLNFNENLSKDSNNLNWKILILDNYSKDILSTTVKVQDLREQGVTLHS